MTETTRLVAPWRRYFARGLDMVVYGTLIQLLQYVVIGVTLRERSAVESVFITFLSVALMVVLEPWLLVRFGTTLGKWILGLNVVDKNGQRLCYNEAFNRTVGALWYGLGAQIPIYSLYRSYRSLVACEAGEELPWEGESQLLLKDEKGWRWLAMLAVWGISIAIVVLGLLLGQFPPNRGELTVAQFAENYNKLMDYYDYSSEYLLDEQGRWVENENLGFNIGFSGDPSNPEFQYTVEDGVITGITLLKASTPGSSMVTGAKMEMTMAVLAFVGAQEERPLWSDEMQTIINFIQDDITTEFDLQLYGVTVSRTVEMEGYVGSSYLLNEGYTTDSYYTAEFIMTK